MKTLNHRSHTPLNVFQSFLEQLFCEAPVSTATK